MAIFSSNPPSRPASYRRLPDTRHRWAALLVAIVLGAAGASADHANGQAVDEPRAPFRVINSNVWAGFQRGAVQEEAAAWIAAQEPDVVAFQELSGFTEESLRALATSWGHAHVRLAGPESERYTGLGLTSRTPIEAAHVVTGTDIRLGVLHARTNGIDFFVVHLGHGSDDVRARERRAVIREIGALLGPVRPSVVLGDFNATSRLDRAFYESHRASMLDAGHGDVYATNDEGYDVLNPDTLDAFMSCGWVDVVHRHHGVMNETQASWPSRARGRARSLIRIDYILASGSLAKRCTAARVMKEPATDRLSDHYPVMAEFDWPE